MNFVEHPLYYDTLDLSFSGCGEMKVDSIDVDFDGFVDVTISSFFEHQGCSVRSVISVLVRDYNTGDFEYNGHVMNDVNGMIKNCSSGGFSDFTSNVSYIFVSREDSQNNAIHTSGYYKVPFEFETTDGVHSGFLFVRYENGGKTITFEGYSWNPIPNSPCSCSSTGWLSIQELNENNIEVDKYFNLMGQEVLEPHGLVIVLYKNGLTKKMYIE